MPYCPECGGEMSYDAHLRRYMCKSCGLSLTSQELMELKDQLQPGKSTDEDERKKRRKEYLDWWFSRKE
jgi:tRNA(Ile2) C34 agmatinyltransferase TiaS